VYCLRLLKQLPVQLILSIILALIMGEKLGLDSVCFFYTISSCFIEILMFVLPLIVFSFILRALVNLERGSLTLLLLIFLGATISNCLALTTAYLFGKATLSFVGLCLSPDFAAKFSSSVSVLFSFNFPKIIATEHALLGGVISGLALNILNQNNPFRKTMKDSSIWLSDKISLFLSKIFIPLLPIYVFGFVSSLVMTMR